MRPLRFLFVISVLAISTVPIAFLIFAIEDKPRIVRQVSLSPDYVARVKEIIDTHRDQTSSGRIMTARILAADIDIAANYLASRFGKGSAKISTADGRALFNLSLPLPENILNGYLNLEVTLAQTAWLPQLQSVQIGRLPLPNFVTNFVLARFTDWLQNNIELRAGMDIIQQIKISHNEVDVIYHWDAEFTQKKSGIPILSKEAQANLFRYNAFLVKSSEKSGAAAVVPLSEILHPLIQYAATRSIKGNAIAENRAAILVTTFHVLGFPLKLLVPEAIDWPTPVKQTIALDGRNDFAKHFMVSAAITVYADTKLSDAIGLYKEIEDLRAGSGFSFNDIAANRAGTRFGEKAVASQASARQLQQLVASELKDTDLMPPWLDLPEHMSKPEFQQLFGGINQPAYKQMAEEIESRVSVLRILRSDEYK